MRGIQRIKKYYRRIRDNFKSKAIILMYHRVTNLRDYTYPITVSPENFRDHIKYLDDQYNIISLQDLVRNIEKRSLKKRTVVITFDDGYADNYENAYPVLKEYNIPATIFITSGYIDSEREFWWDELERIFMTPPSLPDQLEIDLSGKTHRWIFNSLENKNSTRKEIHKLLGELEVIERENILDELVKWAELSKEGRLEHRVMTADELRKLAQSDLIDIGAHTQNHPMLLALPQKSQHEEILNGRMALERIIGSSVTTFSYPFGAHNDEVVELVKSLGFSAACTTKHTSVVLGNDLFRLPRCEIGNWNIETFRGKLLAYLSDYN